MRKLNLFFTFSYLFFLFNFYDFKIMPNHKKNDSTIVSKEQSILQKVVILQNDCELIKNDAIIKRYKDVVFNNANCGVFDPVLTKQWNSKLIVYLDKSIPVWVKKDFIKFYKDLKDINNLKIEFTKNKEKANYLISTTEEDLLAKMDISDKDETYPYSHVYYSLLTDDNSNFYGCKTEINLKAINDKSLILPKLKQLFFISLGQFTTDKKVENNSLLSYSYNNSSDISQKDLKLLKLHYLQIHDKPLSCSTYGKFINNLKSICENEN